MIIINQALADEVFPGQDPLGHELVLQWEDTIPDRIVGVVGNVLHRGLDSKPRSDDVLAARSVSRTVYMTLTVRTQEPAAAIAPLLARTLRQLDPEVAQTPVRPMADLLAATVATTAAGHDADRRVCRACTGPRGVGDLLGGDVRCC